MSEILESHSLWIGAGVVVMAAALAIGRHFTKGKEPQQMGDEVE